ncbi:unnamed protein product, partial [Amoebophrya sp. A25]
ISVPQNDARALPRYKVGDSVRVDYHTSLVSGTFTKGVGPSKGSVTGTISAVRPDAETWYVIDQDCVEPDGEQPRVTTHVGDCAVVSYVLPQLKFSLGSAVQVLENVLPDPTRSRRVVPGVWLDGHVVNTWVMPGRFPYEVQLTGGRRIKVKGLDSENFIRKKPQFALGARVEFISSSSALQRILGSPWQVGVVQQHYPNGSASSSPMYEIRPDTYR